jgi:hypothetical protein
MSAQSNAPAEEYTTQKTIFIIGGYPNPHDVYVLRGAVVRFTNQDPNDYVIRLFSQDPAIMPNVDHFLPAFQSFTLAAGLDLGPNDNSDCGYKVIPIPAATIGVTREAHLALKRDTKTGGGGTIHVGGN